MWLPVEGGVRIPFWERRPGGHAGILNEENKHHRAGPPGRGTRLGGPGRGTANTDEEAAGVPPRPERSSVL